jgi:hypothetical protein
MESRNAAAVKGRLADKVLRLAGGVAPSFDEAWLRYRQQVFHRLDFWLHTIGSGRMRPQMQKQSFAETTGAA